METICVATVTMFPCICYRAPVNSKIFTRASIDFRFEVHNPSSKSINNLDRYSIVPWVTTSDERAVIPINLNSDGDAAIIAERASKYYRTRSDRKRFTCSCSSIDCGSFSSNVRCVAGFEQIFKLLSKSYSNQIVDREQTIVTHIDIFGCSNASHLEKRKTNGWTRTL